MATSSQINSESVPNSAQILLDVSPRLRRKLEKHLAAKEARTAKRKKLTGRKPNWTKNIAKNTAADLFRQLSIREQCVQLLASPDLRLRFEVIRYLWDRLEGKPFTAINPAEVKQNQTVNNDNRLQIAIQQLIPGGVPGVPALKSKKRKALPAQTLEAEPALEATDTAQVIPTVNASAL